MLKRLQKLIALPILLSVIIFLASCGNSQVGTIPSGTPDHGNGTPAVIPTSKPVSQILPPAPASAKGSFYAFVHKNQLWVAMNGGNPKQMTNFDFTNLPNVFWHQPLWSQDHQYILFIMNAYPAGLGGGGCPGPDYKANGALYVLNTATAKLTKIVVPADSANPMVSNPVSGFWQYVFWQDSSHLLAWYNGVLGKTSNNAGLFRYDLNTGSLTEVLSLSALNAGTLFQAQGGLPLLLSMRYSNGQLYYQVVVHAFGQNSQFVIYRHSVSEPGTPSSKVLETGNESWCVPQQNGSYIKPGWDVSSDGEQLVAQMMSTGQEMGSIQVLDLKNGATSELFTQATTQMFAHDLVLTWGPDSQSVVATENHLLSQDGPNSATLANPAATQRYTPNYAGEVSWRPDSSAFALENIDAAGAATTPEMILYTSDATQGRVLLADAQNFAWG